MTQSCFRPLPDAVPTGCSWMDRVARQRACMIALVICYLSYAMNLSREMVHGRMQTMVAWSIERNICLRCSFSTFPRSIEATASMDIPQKKFFCPWEAAYTSAAELLFLYCLEKPTRHISAYQIFGNSSNCVLPSSLDYLRCYDPNEDFCVARCMSRYWHYGTLHC